MNIWVKNHLKNQAKDYYLNNDEYSHLTSQTINQIDTILVPFHQVKEVPDFSEIKNHPEVEWF